MEFVKQSYDGNNFPKIVNEILDENFGKVFFGGGSLIHDLYFKEEDWGDRDYDIWCFHSSYKKVIRKMMHNINSRQIKNKEFKSYYGNFTIIGITEFLIYGIRLQIIDIGNVNSFDPIIRNIDLSFNTVMFDGKNLFFYLTDQEKIISKKGYFIKNEFQCICTKCVTHISEKAQERIKKYEKRGFQIMNVCSFCEERHMSNFSSSLECWKKFLDIEESISVYKYKTGELIEQKIDILINKLNIIENFVDICAGLYLINMCRDMEIFQRLFVHLSEKIKIMPENIFFEVVVKFIEIGSVTGVKLFYSLFKQYNFNEKSGKLFGHACRLNFIGIARFFESLSPRFQMVIYEDKIFEFRFMNIYEYFLETGDVEFILKEVPSLKKIEVLDNYDEDELCPICKYDNPNIALACNHKFCVICLIKFFAQKTRDMETVNCPICRLIITDCKS